MGKDVMPDERKTSFINQETPISQDLAHNPVTDIQRPLGEYTFGPLPMLFLDYASSWQHSFLNAHIHRDSH
jgi:hypothetical protein